MAEPGDDPLVKQVHLHLQEIQHKNAEIERLQLELVKQAHLHREELEHKNAEMERLRYQLQDAQSRMRPLQDEEDNISTSSTKDSVDPHVCPYSRRFTRLNLSLTGMLGDQVNEVKRLTAELETLKVKHEEELKRSAEALERLQREYEQLDHEQREALRQKDAELERVRALLLDAKSSEGSPELEHAHREALQRKDLEREGLQREALRLRDDAMKRQLEKESLAARIQEMERSHRRQVDEITKGANRQRDQFLAALESATNQMHKLWSFVFQQNAKRVFSSRVGSKRARANA